MSNTKEANAARYQRLAQHNPTVMGKAYPSNGQVIVLWEHPINGDTTSVLAVHNGFCCPTGFYESNCDLQTKEYEPHFIDGVLWIGDMRK